jgi:hypothetical protein
VSATYVRRESVISRDIAGQTLLIPVRGQLATLQQVFTVDPVARFIWDRLESPSGEDDVVRGVVAKFEVDEATARKDVREFIRELLDAALIEAA